MRMLADIRCHKAKGGRNRAYFTPSRSQRMENGGPGIPSPHRVNQHPHFHAPARGLAKRMRKGHPDFVPIEDIGHERDCPACLLDRLQHGRISFISVHQRINPIARQQGAIDHAPNDPSQHLQMPCAIRQMALQLFRKTFGLRGLGPVPLKVSSQQSGLVANAIHSEDEVHDSPDQGHEPNEAHPPMAARESRLLRTACPDANTERTTASPMAAMCQTSCTRLPTAIVIAVCP